MENLIVPPTADPTQAETVKQWLDKFSTYKYYVAGAVAALGGILAALYFALAYIAGLSILTLGGSLIAAAPLAGAASGLTLLVAAPLALIKMGNLQATAREIVNQAAKFGMVPKYRDTTKFGVFRAKFGKAKLRDCASDLFITGKDLARQETMYFTNFKLEDGQAFGTFNDMELCAAVMASSAAPTFFWPAKTLVDGGVGAYNNPAFAAAVEALYYSAPEERGPGGELLHRSKYKEGKTVVWSFGTGTIVDHVAEEDLIPSHAEQEGHVVQRDIMVRGDIIPYWLKKIVSDAFDSANSQQVFLCREILKNKMKAIDFKRFELFIDTSSLDNMNLPGDHTAIISNIAMDAVGGGYDQFRELAVRFAQELWNRFARIETTRGRIRELELDERRGHAIDQTELARLKSALTADEASEFEFGKRRRTMTTDQLSAYIAGLNSYSGRT